MEEIQVPMSKLVSIDLIKTDETNPNKMETKQFEALKENIKKYGFINPVITNESFVIADGEHRFLAAKELGLKEIAVIALPIAEVDRRILRQVLNKLHGEHDKRLDFEEFKYLKLNDSIEELQRLLGNPDQKLVQFIAGMQKEDLNADDIEQIENNRSVTVLEGEVWKCGNHFVMCGDATKKEDLDKLLQGSKVDMVFTDPPYNVDYKQYNGQNDKIANDNLAKEKFQEFLSQSLTNMFSVNKGVYYICMSGKEWPTVQRIFEGLGGHWSSTIIWNKNSFVLGRSDYHRKYEAILYGFEKTIEPTYEPILYGWVEGNEYYFNGDRGQSDVWDIEKPVKNDLHPTMKPVVLVERAVINSTKPEMVVLDPFGGSGTTLIACEHLNRKCFTMDLSAYYCEIMIERWQRTTNGTAERILQ